MAQNSCGPQGTACAVPRLQEETLGKGKIGGLWIELLRCSPTQVREKAQEEFLGSSVCTVLASGLG